MLASFERSRRLADKGYRVAETRGNKSDQLWDQYLLNGIKAMNADRDPVSGVSRGPSTVGEAMIGNPNPGLEGARGTWKRSRGKGERRKGRAKSKQPAAKGGLGVDQLIGKSSY